MKHESIPGQSTLWTRPEDAPKLKRAKELVRCAHRELDKRTGFYPRWVKEGKMSQEQAESETQWMREIFYLLRHIANEPDLVERLPLNCSWDAMGIPIPPD